MRVDAMATRAGRWWAIEVREVDGAFTQVRRLDQAADAVRDVVSLLEGVSPDDVDVQITVVLADDVAEALDSVKDDRLRAEQLARAASARLARTARELTEQGLTVRDIGHVLGVSHQRVAQIVRGKVESTSVPDDRRSDTVDDEDSAVRSSRYVARSVVGDRRRVVSRDPTSR